MSSEIQSNAKELELLRAEKIKLLEQLGRVESERNQYLQNVSHQIVTPLNAIKWHIENLTEARVSIDRAKKVLRSIYSQATLAVHLAKNFKLMSNLETEHDLRSLKEPLQEVELCPLLINLADDFQPLSWDQDIHIEVVNGALEKAPPVLAMRPLISQVFSNILENAVKYANKGTRITIDGTYLPEADSVQVVIRNQGIPLHENDFVHVFDRGFRSEAAVRKYPAGTGFGLYIARRIVELHEGSIKAENKNGWTMFTVELSVKQLAGKARHRA